MADLRNRKNKKKPYQVRFLDKSKKSGYGYQSFSRWSDANKFKAQKDLEEQSLQQTSSEIKEVGQAVDKWLGICEKEGTDGNDPVTAYTLANYEYFAKFMKAYPWERSIQELNWLRVLGSAEAHYAWV